MTVNTKISGIINNRMTTGARIPKLYNENKNDSRSVSCCVWNNMGFGKPSGPSLIYMRQ